PASMASKNSSTCVGTSIWYRLAIAWTTSRRFRENWLTLLVTVSAAVGPGRGLGKVEAVGELALWASRVTSLARERPTVRLSRRKRSVMSMNSAHPQTTNHRRRERALDASPEAELGELSFLIDRFQLLVTPVLT